MLRAIDSAALTPLKSYEHRQLLHRARHYIYIKGAVNAVIALLFLLTFPPALKPAMVAIVLADALLLAPYWFLVQRYPIWATFLSLGITALVISAGDWIGGYQTGASGILYALLIMGGHLILIKPTSTYLLSGLITAIYVGTIALEVKGVIPIRFPFTLSNLSRVVSLSVISMLGLTVLMGVVTRLYRELLQHSEKERKRAVQLAVVNEVGRQAASILNMDQLLPEVVIAIQQGFNYYNVILGLLDEAAGELEMRAIAGGFADLAAPGYRQAVGVGMVGWVAQTGQSLLANDVSQEPRYISGFLGETFTGSELCVPLQLAGQVIGVLDVLDSQLNAFDETDQMAMETLADQIAVAIENARLYQQTDKKLQTKVRELTALYAIAATANQSDLDTVLQVALDSAIRLTGMDSGGILLLDPSTNVFSLRAHRGWSPELIQATSQVKVNEGLMPRMLKSVLVIDDLSKLSEERRLAAEKKGFQCVVTIPLKTKESTLGVMGLESHSPRTFSREELEPLAAIGNQVGVVVDRANLQAQELRAIILEERQVMAQQIHDDIAQTLGYLGLQMDRVMGNPSLAQNVEVQAELEQIRRAIEDAYRRVRGSIVRLEEEVPAHFDLGTALPEMISEFEKKTGCKVESRVDRDQLPRLPLPVAFQAIYIIREALANISKHSGADSVHLTLRGLEDGRIEVTIQDNGQGFDPHSEPPSGRAGFGLRFMRERAERIGSDLRIESEPGQGTRIVVSLPVGLKEDENAIQKGSHSRRSRALS